MPQLFSARIFIVSTTTRKNRKKQRRLERRSFFGSFATRIFQLLTCSCQTRFWSAQPNFQCFPQSSDVHSVHQYNLTLSDTVPIAKQWLPINLTGKWLHRKIFGFRNLSVFRQTVNQMICQIPSSGLRRRYCNASFTQSDATKPKKNQSE